jgi:arginine:agmatine antiporter
MSLGNEGTAAGGSHRSVGVWGAAALVAGSMIGSGVYLLPATLGATGSVSLLGWIAATLSALAIAGVFIWLAVLAPGCDGMGDYVRAGMGPFCGVQAVVLYWTSIWAGLVPVALAVTGALGFLLPALQPQGPRLAVTIGVIWLAVGCCWAGARWVARIEGLTLALGLAPVVAAATAGWFYFHPDIFAASWNPSGAPLGSAIRSSALNCFWAYLGLESAAAAAGVVRDPGRNVPRATLLGVLATAALYIAASAVLMGLLPSSQLASSTAPFADAARSAVGAGLGALISACIALRATGCLVGWSLVAAETTRTGADSGIFPRLFRSRAGERVSTPGLLAAGVLMTALALVTTAPSLAQQFATLINTVSLLCLYTYVLAALSLLRLLAGQSPRRQLGAGLTALVATACAGTLIVSARPSELAWSGLGVVFAALLYLWLRMKTPAAANPVSPLA